MKKFKTIMTALGLAASIGTLGLMTACGPTDNGGNGTEPTDGEYVFEAEGCDLTGLSGHGYSNEAKEEQMILGENTKAIRNNKSVLDSISNEHFVGYFNTADTTLEFVITADVASENNVMKIRLGSEYGTLRLDPSVFEIKVNGTALKYDRISVTGNAIGNVTTDTGYKAVFKDYEISQKFALDAGENTVTVTILDNNLGESFGVETLRCVGPGVDCIKIKSDSKLTWNSRWEDNRQNMSYEE